MCMTLAKLFQIPTPRNFLTTKLNVFPGQSVYVLHSINSILMEVNERLRESRVCFFLFFSPPVGVQGERQQQHIKGMLSIMH